MIRFDVETMCARIEATLKADLPAKLLEVEAEKVALSVGVEGGLASVETAAYHFQSWSDAILSHSPSIFYGIKNSEVIGSEGGVTALKYTIFVDLILADKLLGDETKRILRYSRAIKEVLEAKWDRIGNGTKAVINAVTPMNMQVALDSSDEVKVGGVEIYAIIV